MKSLTKLIAILNLLCVVAGCEVEDPVKEDSPELVTEVYLSFTSPSGETVTAIATDPDGEGVADLEILQPIELDAETSYTLSISLINGLVEPLDPAHDLTEEVREESGEHLFLFGWSGVSFSEPSGDGNIDGRDGEVLYLDHDSNGLPLGLETEWATGVSGSGNFRVVLKHQPETKSSTSGFEEGETDLDITFPLTVQ